LIANGRPACGLDNAPEMRLDASGFEPSGSVTLIDR